MNLFAEVGPELSGIEQLRRLMASGRRAGIDQTLDFALVEVEDGRVAFVGTPGVRVYNPIGSVHGGYIATMLDSACGYAVKSKLAPHYGYVTLDLKLSYLRAITANSGPMRAEGNVLSMGRRVAFAEARMIDAAGRLHASATSTLLVTAP